MGDIELAVKWSKRLESALERRYGARGRGLHEKIDSVEADLPERAVRDLRLVATVRNKIVHDDGYDRIERKGEFRAACRRAERDLATRSERWRLRILIAIGLLVVSGVVALMQGLDVIQIIPKFR
jgi:hypothetical protein